MKPVDQRVRDPNPTSRLVNAKGDLIVASADDTPARLPVGADNRFLQALASATNGVQWGGGIATYTPTWTAVTTNPVIGNGTLTGRFLQIGDVVFVAIWL